MHENSYGQKEHAFRAEIALIPDYIAASWLWSKPRT